MRRVLLASVLVHVGAVALLLLPHLPSSPLPPEQPARMEVIFGHGGATPTPPAGSPAAAEPPADGAAAATAAVPAPVRLAGADPGLLVDRPDPSMIPARDDPGNHGPAYPPSAWHRHEQGTVMVRLHIGADGTVAWLEKLRSSGYAALDDAATAALARWHFLPARRGGEAVASYRDQPVSFVIE